MKTYKDFDAYELRELAQFVLTNKAGSLYHLIVKEEDKTNTENCSLEKLKKEYKNVTAIMKDSSIMLDRNKLIDALNTHVVCYALTHPNNSRWTL